MSEGNLTLAENQGRVHRRGFIAAAGATLGVYGTGKATAVNSRLENSTETTDSSTDAEGVTGVPSLDVYEAKWLSDRLVELKFENPLMSPPMSHTNVRVLLPPGYDMTNKRYPSIYLLHGGEGSAATYTTNNEGPGPIQNYITDNAIVVMPDGGPVMWYTDWFNAGSFGPPKVETFHTRQLIPFIESHFRVQKTRESRVVGGFSMGSVGALKYGARHPDIFSGVFASSGTPYLIDWAKKQAGQDELARPRKGAFRAWGDPRTHETRWKGHSPNHLAENYGSTKLYIAVGKRGLDKRAYEFGNVLVKNLEKANVDYTYETFEKRGHEMGWAHRDLRRWQSDIREIFEERSSNQTSLGHKQGSKNEDGFNFKSIDPNFEIWGWQVSQQDVDRKTAEFLTLENVNPTGLTVSGHGMIRIVSPPIYRPYADYRISTDEEDANVRQRTTTADTTGRLDFTVTTNILSADCGMWVSNDIPSATISIESTDE